MTVSTDIVSSRSLFPASKKSYAKIAHVLDMPNLIKMQLDSFDWFMSEGLRELFDEISPIPDFTGSKMELRFGEYSFGEPKYDEGECRERDMTYAAPLRVDVELHRQGDGRDQGAGHLHGRLPAHDRQRHLHHQRRRARRRLPARALAGRLLHAWRRTRPPAATCAWASSSRTAAPGSSSRPRNRDVMSVKVDRKRKIPVTTLLRALDADRGRARRRQRGTDERILALFDGRRRRTRTTTSSRRRSTRRRPRQRGSEALLEFYRRLRPGDPPTLENARTLLNSLFFNFRRYDLRQGRPLQGQQAPRAADADRRRAS